MFKVFLVLVLVVAFSGVASADSNSSLNACVAKAVKVQFGADAKENIQKVNEGIRACREEVQTLVAQERDAKKAKNTAKRVARLQAQLAKLTK